MKLNIVIGSLIHFKKKNQEKQFSQQIISYLSEVFVLPSVFYYCFLKCTSLEVY